MRLKQIITVILLIFANTFLLAHTVLPHSHHDGIICFSLDELKHQNHCSDQHDDIGSCCCEHDKKTHHHANSGDCDLKDIILRQQDNGHKDILPCANCLSLAYTLYTLNEFFLETPEFGERLKLKPYLENYTPPFVGSIRSLRAPPVSYFLG